MTLSNKKKTMGVFVTVVALLALTACGGGSGSAVNDAPSSPASKAATKPTAAPAPKTAPEPTAAPAPKAAPEPTAVPEATVVPVPAATPVPPTATPVPPTATPAPPLVLDEFGFSLRLDRGAYVTNLPGNTDAQGMVQLEYSGVNVILSWVPIDGVTNEGLVTGMFKMLQDSQSDITLNTVSEGSFNVGLESGLVIGFKSFDGSGDVVGGGLIGAWNCVDSENSFTITVTGQDASVVQLRFNRLTNNFDCAQD